MTYNVLFGGVGREARIREVVRSVNPDVAVFTEVTTDAAFSAIADGVGPHRVLAPKLFGRTRVGIASRWPIDQFEPHGPGWSPFKWIEATLRPHQGQTVTVHAVQLVAQPLWPFELWRQQEVRSLVKRLRARARSAQIVAGDFNSLMIGDTQRPEGAPPWVRAQWLLQGGATSRWALQGLTDAGYSDCFRLCNPDANGFTVPAHDLSARIDYVFVSPELKSRVSASGTSLVESRDGFASDHVPVWADLRWSP